MVFDWKEYRFYIVTLGMVLVIVGTVSAVLTSGQSGQAHPVKKDLSFIQSHPAKPVVKKPKLIPSVLPHGGRVLFPQYSLAALYGSPDGPALGALGEQPMDATLERAKQLASQYQPLTKTIVLPALEIIATTASASPTDNGDYSREADANALLPWVQAAQKAGAYVVLDLQPGRSDFLSQAKAYQDLLRYPNVGLALDPEWRLKPDQVHLAQIGSVDAAEINQTTSWLAALTSSNRLPQKLLLLHQFRLDMITNRETLNTAHPELATVIQMDGSGTQQQKQSTWQTITQNAPANTQFGWKNFYKQDTPILSPEDTMKVVPAPVYVSYQ